MILEFIAVGLGPGDPELITLKALKTVSEADMILIPVSGPGRTSVAETILRTHMENLRIFPVVFPMTRDGAARDKSLRDQLEALRGRWENAAKIVLPVIGDAALYATAAYLYDVWRQMVPRLTLSLLPGVSAHSLVAARAGRFLALGEDIFTIIPGTAEIPAIEKALASCNSAALYKPSALKEHLREVVERTGPWSEILRIDRAGFSEEVIFVGNEALAPVSEYLSALLLWR